MIRDRKDSQNYAEDKPLVTFALLTYNQDMFIEAALHGVLSQDYPNLEIVISDDCSRDNTFLIIQRTITAYNGLHRIKINQNLTNLGLGQHVNQIMKIATGDLIVLAAGDDISNSRRVSLLVEAWEAAERPPAICSQAVIISTQGELMSERYDGYDGRYPHQGETRFQSITRLLETDHCLLLGCTEAWTPRVFDVFGSLSKDVVHEDNAVSLRAWLLGNIVFLETPLVQYRTHSQNIAYRVQTVPRTISQFASRETVYSAKQSAALAHLQQYSKDLQTAYSLDLISLEELAAFSALLNKRLFLARMQANWWAFPFSRKFMALFSAVGIGSFRMITWGLPRLAGLNIFSFGRACFALISRMRRNIVNQFKLEKVY